MKRWSIIIAAAVMAAWMVVNLISDVSDAIPYFSSKPQRLLYVAGLAVAGGLAALAFARLSCRAKRRICLVGWGAAASAMTLCIGYLLFRLASLFSSVVESGATGWVFLGLLLFAAIAAYFWFEFYRAWKAGVSSDPAS